jgi:hypothetical protein
VFGRKKDADRAGSTSATAEPARPEEAAGRQTPGKGRPTPSRREREAARRRPLVPEDRKAAKAQSRDANREARLKAQAGLAAGDERYLGPRDRGPQRRFARDWVDSRYNVGDFLMIVLLAAIVVLFFPNQLVQSYGVYFVWAFTVLAVLDTIFMTARLQKAARAKFGTVQPGLRWYAAMRTLTLRRTRLPKPQVARGRRPA